MAHPRSQPWLMEQNHQQGRSLGLCSGVTEVLMASRPSRSLVLAPKLVSAPSFLTVAWEARPWYRVYFPEELPSFLSGY